MPMAPTALLIGGEWREAAERFDVRNPYDGTRVADVSRAVPADATAAIDGARPPVLSPYERAGVLSRARAHLAGQREAVARTVIAETGFTTKDVAGEIDRCLETLALSAEEAKRIAGEVVPFEGAPDGAGRFGYTRHEPLGIVVCITPFNAPLNTVAHKIAPAFAAGNAVILKPAERTPLSAALLCQALVEGGAPPGSISLLQGAGAEIGPALLADPRPAFFAFTGSTAVGKRIHAAAGLRRTQMELGSIAATLVLSDADPDIVAGAVAAAGYRKAGQVCTSVQLLFVEHTLGEAVTDALLERVGALRSGDPAIPDTEVGPVICASDAERIAGWVAEAEARGARVLAGGEREGCLVAPTLVDRVSQEMALRNREVFGPVVSIVPVRDLDEGIAEVNASPYGLAAGVFTNDLGRAQRCVEELEVGGVHVNQTSSARADLMPYGGWKESGFGHEGPGYAIREMTREKLVSIRAVP